MPFHPRHEISYQWPTQCCGWVSSVGQKKLPFISAVKCEDLSAISGAGSCGVAFGMNCQSGSYNSKLIVFICPAGS